MTRLSRSFVHFLLLILDRTLRTVFLCLLSLAMCNKPETPSDYLVLWGLGMLAISWIQPRKD